MNNRNVDVLRIANIKSTFPSLIANTALQVTTAHDQKYSTFKMAAEAKKHQREKTLRKKNPEAGIKVKWQRRRKKKRGNDGILLYHVLLLLCPFHIIVAHRKWIICVLFFYSVTKNDCTSATTEFRDNYADRRQETAYYLFLFFYLMCFTQMGRELQNVYLSLT